MTGGGSNVTPLLAVPATVTTTLPMVAPEGAGTKMLVLPHDIGVAPVPLNVTVLVPCVAPKLAPEIVTKVSGSPEVGDMPVIPGPDPRTKPTPLLVTPATVTTMLPVVAPLGTGTTMLVGLQLVGVATVPLNVTMLAPCMAPKLAPEIVTGVPTVPE